MKDAARKCPECGKNSPAGIPPNPSWTERTWIVPAWVALMLALLYAWFTGRFGNAPSLTVRLDWLIFLGIPIAAVANGILMFGICAYVYYKYPIPGLGRWRSIARAYCIGALVAVLTLIFLGAVVFGGDSH